MTELQGKSFYVPLSSSGLENNQISTTQIYKKGKKTKYFNINIY